MQAWNKICDRQLDGGSLELQICPKFVSEQSQCKTLSQSPKHLIIYYLWYFTDVVAYLLKKEIEKIRLQIHIVRCNK